MKERVKVTINNTIYEFETSYGISMSELINNLKIIIEQHNKIIK